MQPWHVAMIATTVVESKCVTSAPVNMSLRIFGLEKTSISHINSTAYLNCKVNVSLDFGCEAKVSPIHLFFIYIIYIKCNENILNF